MWMWSYPKWLENHPYINLSNPDVSADQSFCFCQKSFHSKKQQKLSEILPTNGYDVIKTFPQSTKQNPELKDHLFSRRKTSGFMTTVAILFVAIYGFHAAKV